MKVVKSLFLFFTGSGILSSILIYQLVLRDSLDIPKIPDTYWGSEPREGEEDVSISPFKINISDKILADLRIRLQLEISTHDEILSEGLEGPKFLYGTSKEFIKNLTHHWYHNYNWRERERRMNKYPNYKTRISGLDIHFQHVRPKREGKFGSRPLLLLNGWGSTFAEFLKQIPLLTDNPDMTFELVIPSLPGFGFSEATRKPGLGTTQMAPIFLKLMKRLGHEKFYVQAGDWGSSIGISMATMFPDNVLGLHSTMCFPLHPRVLLKTAVAFAFPSIFMEEEERGLEKFKNVYSRTHPEIVKELGYFFIQATRPDRLGVALSHSPSGWAAYMLGLYSWAADPSYHEKWDGGLYERYDKDDVLDNVMIYWVTRSVTTSMRIYPQCRDTYIPWEWLNEVNRAPVRTWATCLNLPNEPGVFPKFGLEAKFPKLKYRVGKVGGHWHVLEFPEEMAQDVIESMIAMDMEYKN